MLIISLVPMKKTIAGTLHYPKNKTNVLRLSMAGTLHYPKNKTNVLRLSRLAKKKSSRVQYK